MGSNPSAPTTSLVRLPLDGAPAHTLIAAAYWPFAIVVYLAEAYWPLIFLLHGPDLAACLLK